MAIQQMIGNMAKGIKLVALVIFCTMGTQLASAQEAKPSPAKKTASKVLYGTASFYANKFNGRKTANGEIFSQAKLTCACNVLPHGYLATGNQPAQWQNHRSEGERSAAPQNAPFVGSHPHGGPKTWLRKCGPHKGKSGGFGQKLPPIGIFWSFLALFCCKTPFFQV
jgi:hypothetical protein